MLCNVLLFCQSYMSPYSSSSRQCKGLLLAMPTLNHLYLLCFFSSNYLFHPLIFNLLRIIFLIPVYLVDVSPHVGQPSKLLATKLTPEIWLNLCPPLQKRWQTMISFWMLPDNMELQCLRSRQHQGAIITLYTISPGNHHAWFGSRT